jgi:quinol monooxygenase YgiN
MLVRIVRMQFDAEKVEDFKKMFNETYSRIRNFKGCRFLELYTDEDEPNVFYTMSKWDDVNKLEEYRHSELFRETWAITKTYFSGVPVAYSLTRNVEDAINPF